MFRFLSVRNISVLNLIKRTRKSSGVQGIYRNQSIGVLPSVSPDNTHHVWNSANPVYSLRFKNVLSYHSPEYLAAVEDEFGSAFHIDMNGQPAYSSRFKRTFGYYNKLASVESFNDGCYHVDVNGRPVYDSRFEWCGNFTKLPSSSLPFNGSQAQAPVRLFNKNYLHINERGEVLGGPYLYAGDCNTQGQSVVWDLAGQCLVVNYDKSLWCAPEGPNKLVNKLLEMRLPHKGIAATRDDRGWYFVDRLGCEVGSGRYLDVEPHYNGQARVRLITGAWAIIDEQGFVLVELGQSLSEMQADLVAVSQKYWQSIALKMVMETKVLDAIDEQKVRLQFCIFIGFT
jgi:hypothetical protein